MLDRRAAVHDHRQPRGVGDLGRLPVDDAELQPQRARPRFDCAPSDGRRVLAAPEHVDDVEAARGLYRLLDRAARGNAQHGVGVGVDRHTVVSLAKQVAHHTVRGPARVGRRTYDRDSARLTEQLEDLVIAEQGEGSGVLLGVENVGRAPAFLVAQAVDSFSYGRPTAAGGMLRPTTPARMMIVMR